MNIKNHQLFQNKKKVRYEKTTNRGSSIDPLFLIIHYTATATAEDAIRWFQNPAANASAHLVIERDGSITQMVDFNKMAWHAGKSSWGVYKGLNSYSIGIELANAGKMVRHKCQWRAWFGQDYPDDDVMVASHKYEDEEFGWHLYTVSQLKACIEVASVLIQEYDLIDVLGHDDISPGRKVDPGPAFPMQSFRAKVLGRADQNDLLFQTRVRLNIREGAGTQFPTLLAEPLPEGTKVDILRYHREWRFVEVMHEVAGYNDLQGWVHGHYLEPVENQSNSMVM